MPQVRDEKTGRYTSAGGSAGTNPRIQKAKAVGGGATAGGASLGYDGLTPSQAESRLKKMQPGTISTGVKLSYGDLAKADQWGNDSKYGSSAKSQSHEIKIEKFYSPGGRGSKAGNYYSIEAGGHGRKTLITSKDASVLLTAKNKAAAYKHFHTNYSMKGYQD